MDAFSYLSVLLSIILGLGMTQLLTAFGRLIRHRDRVRFDWLPVMWAMVLVVAYVQVWWAMFGLKGVNDWTFIRFLAVLAQVITLYMMAALVLPEQVEETGVDLREHYDRHHRWSFGFFIATLVISVLKDVIVSGELPGAMNLAFHAVFVAASLVGVVARHRRVHEALGVFAAVSMTLYIGLLFTRLQ